MAKKKSNKLKNFKEKSSNLENRVLGFFKQNPDTTVTAKQLSRKLQFKGDRRINILLDVLLDLEIKGKVSQVEPGVFVSAGYKDKIITGKLDFVNPRFAFIVSDELDKDLKVSVDKLNFALHGDVVRVAIKASSGDKGLLGEVIEILSRSRDEFVGTMQFSSKFAFLIPDQRRMHMDIFIPLDQVGDAKNGDKAIIKITQWPKKGKNPSGKVIKVLGKAGLHDVEMHAIMAEFDLPMDFPKEVEKEANNISTEITKEEVSKRRDMRDITTFTIDPEEAKDFDDALSVKYMDNGHYEIGIHIADVSHYLREDTKLEEEAFRRATSVYLVDRVVPMLPEKLSNELCSLRADEDKLTFSAVFELDDEGKVYHEWFGRTVIRSNKRFVYEEAQEVMDTGKGDFRDELILLNSIAKKLSAKRFAKGSIAFETQEVKFKLAEDGTPLEVVAKVRKDVHKLIEEFMLLANKHVAEYVYNKRKEDKLTMVYRVHENPDPEKLNIFGAFAKRFGYNINLEKNVPKALNKLTQEALGKPEESLLQSLAIRSMSKARYTTEAIPHFGLAFPQYTHFTSPIRRYPDVMVHRLLQRYLDGGKSADKDEYQEKCVHSSEREKVAADAERASIKYKQVEYMSNMEDRDFVGIISGMTEWGMFVELVENKCEGMIRVADLSDDFYEFDKDNLRLIGRRNKKMFTFGDQVTVRVKGTDMVNRTIDMKLSE